MQAIPIKEDSNLQLNNVKQKRESVEDNSSDEPSTFTLTRSQTGVRLDKTLAALLPEFSRERIKKWIEQGAVTVNGVRAQKRQNGYADDEVIVWSQPSDEESAFAPEPIALDVVHADEAIIVINKPAGLVTHPAAGNWQGTLLNGLLHHFPELTHIPRAGIVHRLDKDTSGLLVVARTLQAQTDLVRQLQARSVARHYWALVMGQVEAPGMVDAPIGRDPKSRVKMVVMEDTYSGAKDAVTHYTPVAYSESHDVTWVQCKLETGRTHQIRVHMQALGHALVGDAVYVQKFVPQYLNLVQAHNARYPSSARPLPKTTRARVFGMDAVLNAFPRQALHAYSLGLLHPLTQQTVQWQCPLPADMQGLLKQCAIENKM